MDIKDRADEFLAQERIAVVGVSRSAGTGNSILKTLRARGHDVVAINPHAETIDGEVCYPSVQAVPGGVNAVVIVTQPAAAEAVARDCVEAGVSHVWMHYNALFGCWQQQCVNRSDDLSAPERGSRHPRWLPTDVRRTGGCGP